MRRPRVLRPSGVGRPLTLLRTFLIASAVILALGAIVLSSRLSSHLRAAALADNARDTAAYADAVIAPAVVRGNSVVVAPSTRRRLARSIHLPEDVRGLNVYARNGRLVFSTTRPERVGRRRASPDLKAVLKTDEPTADLVDPMGPASEIVRVWTPLHSAGGVPVGATEVALDGAVVTDTIADARWLVRGRDRFRAPLARAGPSRKRRVRADARAERGPRGAFT